MNNHTHTVCHLTNASGYFNATDDSSNNDLEPNDLLTLICAVHGQSPASNKCALCHSEGHELIDCFKYIDYNLCVQLQKTYPSLAAKILASIVTLPVSAVLLFLRRNFTRLQVQMFVY